MENKNILGLDVLRGIGIFTVIFLHSAFYYYDDIFQLDFNEPPLIITLIGLLLMFAGLFAMISGLVHTWQFYQKQNITNSSIFKYKIKFGLIVLLIAYLYFIFTGPGLINFELENFDNSILVDLIRFQKLTLPSLDRLTYVDSLVMIGLNIILLTVVFRIMKHVSLKKAPPLFLSLALVWILLSLIRLPLYEFWQTSFDEGRLLYLVPLNLLVAKNNPISPFFSFALFGSWLATLLLNYDLKVVIKKTLPIGLVLFVTGILLYLNLEDTMLERQIDLKWYSIMIAQLGLFILLIILFIKRYSNKSENKLVTIFFTNFSKGGLSAFFFESVISALIYRVLIMIFPNLYLNMTKGLLFGFALAMLWGMGLMIWRKYHFKYSLEYLIANRLNKSAPSTKLKKLVKTEP